MLQQRPSSSASSVASSASWGSCGHDDDGTGALLHAHAHAHAHANNKSGSNIIIAIINNTGDRPGNVNNNTTNNSNERGGGDTHANGHNMTGYATAHDHVAPRDRHDSSASASSRSCEGMTAHQTRLLWQCMLQLQQRYGCYKSTRVALAVTAGDAGVHLMPNPFIIDTLNESVVDLPDEGWRMLDRCIRPPEQKPKRRFWSRH